MKTIDEDPDTLQRQADAARTHLAATLDALDRKRHDLVDVRLQASRHRLAIGAAVAVLGLALGGAAVAIGVRSARRREHRWRLRWDAARRVWRHPERIASSRRGPFANELGRRVLVGTLGFAGVQLGKRLVRGLVG